MGGGTQKKEMEEKQFHSKERRKKVLYEVRRCTRSIGKRSHGGSTTENREKGRGAPWLKQRGRDQTSLQHVHLQRRDKREIPVLQREGPNTAVWGDFKTQGGEHRPDPFLVVEKRTSVSPWRGNHYPLSKTSASGHCRLEEKKRRTDWALSEGRIAKEGKGKKDALA